MTQPHSSRRILIWTLRLLILAGVIYGVGRTFRGALANLDAHDWEAQPGWLVLAGGLYLLGLLAMGNYWRHLLAAYDQEAPFYPAISAYFLGHLGKYSPGKALVPLLRVGALKRWIPSNWLGLWTVVLETLKLMSVGAVIGGFLSARFLSMSSQLATLVVALAAGVFVGTLPPVVRGLGRPSLGKLAARLRRDVDGATDKSDKLFTPITWPLWLHGWFASSICWLMFALSLWAVLKSIGNVDLHPVTDLPICLTTVTISVVAGFLSFLPGGLVVRDGLVLQLLTPHCGESHALVAAVLLRFVWLVSEILVCGILYLGALYCRRGRPE